MDRSDIARPTDRTGTRRPLFEVASEHLAASGVAPKANGLERKHAELRPEAKPVSGPEIRARSLHGTPNQSAPVENLLTPEQQETLQRNATLLKYRSGNVVFHESEDAHFLYFIVEGVVRISRSGENGRRQILAFSVPGDLFGIPDAGHYVNSAETVCATQVYRVPWPRMQQLMADEPPLQLHLLAKLGYDLRQAQARIMTLGVQTIPQRLASFLLEFALLPNWFDEEQRYLKLPMNRFDMADYLGTAPESTARAFAKLESEGLVRRVSSRTLEILDIGGLENLRKGHVKRRSSRIPITSDCERG